LSLGRRASILCAVSEWKACMTSVASRPANMSIHSVPAGGGRVNGEATTRRTPGWGVERARPQRARPGARARTPDAQGGAGGRSAAGDAAGRTGSGWRWAGAGGRTRVGHPPAGQVIPLVVDAHVQRLARLPGRRPARLAHGPAILAAGRRSGRSGDCYTWRGRGSHGATRERSGRRGWRGEDAVRPRRLLASRRGTRAQGGRARRGASGAHARHQALHAPALLQASAQRNTGPAPVHGRWQGS